MSQIENGSTDQQLVEAAKLNPDDFGQLVACYWNRLFGYLRRSFYFSREDMEDILQEVFVKVYKHLNDYDSTMSFSTWIYQIARNTAIDEIRRKKARPQSIQLETEELVQVLKSSLDVEKEVATNDSLDKVKKIINSIPANYKEVLILKFLEEKSYEEIMDIMQIPKGTVASLVSRGRKMIIEQAKKQSII